MANDADLKAVVKHIVDGTFGDYLCRICLLPLGDDGENIFTKICTAEREFSVADVLEEVCNVKISDTDQNNICSACFTSASNAYKFYALSHRSNEIINFYVDEIQNNLSSIEIPPDQSDSLCITLPIIAPEIPNLGYDLQSSINKFVLGSKVSKVSNIKKENKTRNLQEPLQIKGIITRKPEEDIIIVIKETGEQSFYKFNSDGSLEFMNNEKNKIDGTTNLVSVMKPKVKIRRKRDPMIYKQCSQCPVKYRFIAKLKDHMKVDHNIDLFVCKVCKATFEVEQEFNNHLKTHTNIHRCAICNTVFRKRDTIISHLKWHDEMTNLSQLEGAHVCELCGIILPDEEHLKDHYDKKHDKKYTCFYCGRMYRGETSFEMHIKKHEMHLESKKRSADVLPNRAADISKPLKQSKGDKERFGCDTCGRNFVDERSLMWHTMLHTNERPYSCNVCGRGFVSVNRRNQHAVCAHTAPARRCPLCPALFHLRSMVNSHIKKVHLKAHKRRNRTSKHQNVFWRTEPVPIQELSVSIQNQILELQTKNEALAKLEMEADATEFEWVRNSI